MTIDADFMRKWKNQPPVLNNYCGSTPPQPSSAYQLATEGSKLASVASIISERSEHN